MPKEVNYRKLLVKNKIAGMAQCLGVSSAWISRQYKKSIEEAVSKMSDDDVFRNMMLVEEFGAVRYVHAVASSALGQCPTSEQEANLDAFFSNVGVDGSPERQGDEGMEDGLSAS